jgi:H+-transporting ATPase
MVRGFTRHWVAVGYIEESNAGDAIAALKQQLAPKCHALRNGQYVATTAALRKTSNPCFHLPGDPFSCVFHDPHHYPCCRWKTVPGRELVPGDLIEIKLGDVMPADALLMPGMTIDCDESALTGESLPVTHHPYERLMMGSAVKRGESKCIVVGTGKNTAFGTAAKLMAGVVHQGRFQKILFKITLVLLIICLIFSTAILIKLVVDGDNSTGYFSTLTGSKPIRVLSTVVVIFVASIPIAIEVVCTSTLAVGSRRLAQKKVIVARLSAIEELAGMTILCSDKTGTLTLNQLQLREPKIYTARDAFDIVFHSALASKREKGNQDAIDKVITDAIPREHEAYLMSFKEIEFVPFNPTDKRTEATLQSPTGQVLKVSKGAPQVILRLCANKDEIRSRVEADVQELGDRGFRSLAVAVSRRPVGEPPVWEFMGILSLFDPPRPDTKKTIEAAGANGVLVKMITGDHQVIAKETCRELGMGTNILNTEVLNDKSLAREQLDEIIFNAHGFAEVMPEHKFQIVQTLREQGHVTGMTGDGVNDAPALKRADIGIAVHGATDAAKAAAAIVLTEPGLSVIIDAIFRSRKIFQRMRNYCIYRISCTLQLLFFFFFAIVSFDLTSDNFYGPKGAPMWNNDPDMSHDSSFALPVISLVIITILNDGTMITIAHDKVIPEKRPQRWAMIEVTIISTVLAFVACISSLILLMMLLHANKSNAGGLVGAALGSEGRDYVLYLEAQTMIYLKISLSDFLTLFAARTRTWFWERRPGYMLGAAALVATGTSTLLSLFWTRIFHTTNFDNTSDNNMRGLDTSKYACVGIWIYCVLWFFAQDIAKVGTYYLLENMHKEDDDRLDNVSKKGIIASMYATVNREARRQGMASGKHVNFEEKVVVPAEFAARVTSLETEVAQLKELIRAAGLATAPAPRGH